MIDTRTINGVPLDLIALEIEHRDEKAAADAQGKNSCHYDAYLASKRVANHPWLTQYPGNSPERRAARKQLRDVADAAQNAMKAEGVTRAVIVAEHIVKQAAAGLGVTGATGLCNWSSCGSTENLTLFSGGQRCPKHTPAALRGLPEPAELAARVEANRPKADGIRASSLAADPCSYCNQPMNHIYADAGMHPWCAEGEEA